MAGKTNRAAIEDQETEKTHKEGKCKIESVKEERDDTERKKISRVVCLLVFGEQSPNDCQCK